MTRVQPPLIPKYWQKILGQMQSIMGRAWSRSTCLYVEIILRLYGAFLHGNQIGMHHMIVMWPRDSLVMVVDGDCILEMVDQHSAARTVETDSPYVHTVTKQEHCLRLYSSREHNWTFRGGICKYCSQNPTQGGANVTFDLTPLWY